MSVIIRARDEAGNLARCLRLLAAQSGLEAVEVIVVDCGSRDDSVKVARAAGAAVIDAGGGSFSFGAALNRGARDARHDVLVALSAHAFPPDPRWLHRMSVALTDERVACACGDRYDCDGRPLRHAVTQDAALYRRRPEWGYANGAGAFRAPLWRERPFRVDLPGCEDKEWAWHWLAQGQTCLIDPALAVEHDHTHDPVTEIYQRARREAAGYRAFLGDGAPGPADLPGLARAWWSDTRFYASPTRARLSHRRAARLLGAYAGRRAHASA